MSTRGRGFDRGSRGSLRGGNIGRGGRGSPNPRGRGRGGPHPFHGADLGDRGDVVMRGQPANIDQRIADNSDKALVADLTCSRPDSTGMPLRPDFGVAGREIKLRANFFPVRVPKGSLYEYNVSISPMWAATRRVKRRIYQLAEQTVTWHQAGMSGRVAHDGNAKLIAAVELPQPLDVVVQYYDEDGVGPPQTGGREYTLSIRLTQRIDTGNLEKYLSGHVSFRNYDALPVISALSLILAAVPSRTGILVGRNHYFFPGAIQPQSLGGGLEAWKGFYFSLRPTFKQLMVNVNICTTAFYTPGNLAVVMMFFQRSSFGAWIDAFCRGVWIRIIHLGRQKLVKNLVHHTARSYSFDTLNYGRVTMEEYFRRRYNIKLRYPELQLVDVGRLNQTACYLPPEVCEILQDQPFHRKLTEEHTTAMITIARQPPNTNREAVVNHGLDCLGMRVAGPELQSFGISIGPEMAVVPARILPWPEIRYLTSPASIDNRASWNLRGAEFAVGAHLDKWTVLVIKDGTRDEFTGSSDPDLHLVVSRFRDMCQASGMQITADPNYVTAQLPHKDASDPLRQTAITAIRKALMNVKPKPTLVFVMLASQDEAVYDGLKHLCDVLLDVATACVQSSKIRKSSPQYLANVALKVNMKLGGVNHRLDPNSLKGLSNESTMIVGMDVTHPSPGSARGTPSVAAVVASIDNNFAQYPASLVIQESKREMISKLKLMMIDRLKLYQKKNSQKLPTRILVYRAGVSEGLFNIVRNEELPKIIEAFRAFDTPRGRYRPNFTIIICGKRHHTRFFPTEEDSAAGDGNPRPGTVVDRGVTAIYDFDFFLQAHSGSQGMTRPTHYYVIHDEIRFKADEIQGLTNTLSYMFARATKAVSLVHPACYADVACKRGRCYLRKFFLGHADATASGTGSGSASAMEEDIMREAQTLWGEGVSGPGLKDTMFYL